MDTLGAYEAYRETGLSEDLAKLQVRLNEKHFVSKDDLQKETDKTRNDMSIFIKDMEISMRKANTEFIIATGNQWGDRMDQRITRSENHLDDKNKMLMRFIGISVGIATVIISLISLGVFGSA